MKTLVSCFVDQDDSTWFWIVIESYHAQSYAFQPRLHSRAGELNLLRSTITATDQRLCFILVCKYLQDYVHGSLTRFLDCYSSQCGGVGYTGATCCPTGWSCQTQDSYYAQCLSGTVIIVYSVLVLAYYADLLISPLARPGQGSQRVRCRHLRHRLRGRPHIGRQRPSWLAKPYRTTRKCHILRSNATTRIVALELSTLILPLLIAACPGTTA